MITDNAIPNHPNHSHPLIRPVATLPLLLLLLLSVVVVLFVVVSVVAVVVVLLYGIVL